MKNAKPHNPEKPVAPTGFFFQALKSAILLQFK